MEYKNPYKKGGLFEGALPAVFENAKHLRNNMTAAELVLWMHLRAGIGGCKFRRQHPVGMYIADFYCHKAKLVVEVDGSIHNTEAVKHNDQAKETYLINNGFNLLRFKNQEIMTKIEEVLTKITTTVNKKIYKHTPEIGG